jgi:hypothetical protein
VNLAHRPDPVKFAADDGSRFERIHSGSQREELFDLLEIGARHFSQPVQGRAGQIIPSDLALPDQR